MKLHQQAQSKSSGVIARMYDRGKLQTCKCQGKLEALLRSLLELFSEASCQHLTTRLQYDLCLEESNCPVDHRGALSALPSTATASRLFQLSFPCVH